MTHTHAIDVAALRKRLEGRCTLASKEAQKCLEAGCPNPHEEGVEAGLIFALEELAQAVDDGQPVTDAAPRLRAALQATVQHLPSTCRYHDTDLEQENLFAGNGACCDTGLPALVRRRAVAVLDSTA